MVLIDGHPHRGGSDWRAQDRGGRAFRRKPCLALGARRRRPGVGFLRQAKRKDRRGNRHRRPRAAAAGDHLADRVVRPVDELNADPAVDGILVQSPLRPTSMNSRSSAASPRPRTSMAWAPSISARSRRRRIRFHLMHPRRDHGAFRPFGSQPRRTPRRCLGPQPARRKPIALLAVQKKPWANATVTLCHSQTTGLPAITRQATF